MKSAHAIALSCILILILAAALRLVDVHNPILDHPAWRQGDEAAIARNFAELRNNIFYPQTDYDGPPPNYVELELQIVPFAAAQLYRIFGVHEIFLRLLVIAFSLATIPLVLALGAELYSRRAGLIAALLWAIAPGTVYYGRAIIPESVMLFFSAGAMLFWVRFCARRRTLDFFLAAAFMALAALAKPPALVLLAPMLAVLAARTRWRALRDWPAYALLVIVLAPFVAYFAHLHGIAEWHWASGITAKHVLPHLGNALRNPRQLAAAVQSTLALLRMLSTTILGPVLFALLLVAAFAQPPERGPLRRGVLFGAWCAALIAYAFVVVTVERVDYYLLPFALFAIVYASGSLDWILERVLVRPAPLATQAALGVACFFTLYANMLEIHPYYSWSRNVYSAASEVRRVLAPGTLIVLGHYDPSVLYTIGHRGWEEDVLLWNVHDMTSAVAKGARYFVAVEVPRFRANARLFAFMQRYRRVPVASGWQVYDFRHFTLLVRPNPARAPARATVRRSRSQPLPSSARSSRIRGR